MGRLNKAWQLDFLETLTERGIRFKNTETPGLVLLEDHQVAVHLVPLDTEQNPDAFIHLQDNFSQQGVTLVHLWEDIWLTRQPQVLGRIHSLTGLNRRLHGRKATVVAITQKQADDFLQQHHLQASAKVKYKFALMIAEEMVAVALFSAGRPMKQLGADYRSFELVRFATGIGYTVTGGFSKLLKHFINLVKPDDIMSYADRDWSLGNAYARSAFKLVETLPPATICLDQTSLNRLFPHRLPLTLQSELMELDETRQRQQLLHRGYRQIFNTGNLKYILYL